ncbi:MAG TPA: hypothetical protein VL689_06470 [Paraburkholderia sp.]|jgi:hypothetical protein|nr:hypothetical protein [Paraburkholderia sp.]
MSAFVRPSAPVDGNRARAGLAAALIAVCVVGAASPSRARAQQQSDSNASSASANGPGTSNQKTEDDGNLPLATRQTRADQRRLLGGPRSTFDPYGDAAPTPANAEAALTDEQRMTIVSPSTFYSSASPALNAGDGASAGSAAGGGGGGAMKHRFGRAAQADSQQAPGAAKKYDYQSGGPAVAVYRNPYDTQGPAGGQAYRSPW